MFLEKLPFIGRLIREYRISEEIGLEMAQIIGSLRMAIKRQAKDKVFCEQHCIYRDICSREEYAWMSCDAVWQHASLKGEYQRLAKK